MPSRTRSGAQYGKYMPAVDAIVRGVGERLGISVSGAPGTPGGPSWNAKMLDSLGQDRGLKRKAPSGGAQNTTKKKIVSRRRKSSGARSSGFVKAGRRVKRSRKKQRSEARTVKHTVEVGQVLQLAVGRQIGLVGHNTHPINHVAKQSMVALVTELMKRAGFIVEGLNDPICTFINDKITIGFSTGANAQVKDTSFSLAADTTINTIVGFLMANTNEWINNTLQQRSHQEFHYIRFTPISAANMRSRYYELNIRTLKVSISSVSELKIQNRSLEHIDDDEADVDNVPLLGKSYSASANSLYDTRAYTPNNSGGLRDRIDYVTSPSTGMMATQSDAVGSSDTSLGIQEPVDGSYYRGVKRCGGVKIEPGEIKTSKLSSTYTSWFNKLWQNLPKNLDIGAISTSNQNPFGKCRFFMFDKMIDISALSLGMSLALEHNFVLKTHVIVAKTPPIGLGSFEKVYI